MRLLKLEPNGEFRVTPDWMRDLPSYAILSHTWGADTDEVSFKDIMNGLGKTKLGYEKIRFCCEQARRDNLWYFWIDTCCIDKSNMAELTEAINSMFQWYRGAAKGYAYLRDVSKHTSDANDNPGKQTWEAAFQRSRWFTRGWTLQELLAPRIVEFYSKDGEKLGDKTSLERLIHETTRVPVTALRGSPLSNFGVSERISWIEDRQAGRQEDMAYSLLGIVGEYMPLIYGEGKENAFKRLRKGIHSKAEETLPSINQDVSDLATDPIRSVGLKIRLETLPTDPEIILELSLKLDNLFHGTMSFLIAPYREGCTWPESYGFKELDYTEFYLCLRPLYDVRFRWFDRTVEMRPTNRDAVLLSRPQVFNHEFDGEEFTPREKPALPQVYEIPPLNTLIKNRSNFQLVLHNTSTKVDTIVPSESDISIEVEGFIGSEMLQLYRSHTTRDQRDILTTPFLSPPGMSPILQNILLARYCQTLGIGINDSYSRPEVPSDESIERNEFDSEEGRVLAAYDCFDKAGMSFVRSMWQDAYKSYMKASALIYPLVASGTPSLFHATVFYTSASRMVQIWQQQERFVDAKQINDILVNCTRQIKDSDSTVSDFQRMWADALLQDAPIGTELSNQDLVGQRLLEYVDVLYKLYAKLGTPASKLDWMNSLYLSVKMVSDKNMSAEKELTAWKQALRRETGDDKIFDKAVQKPLPGALPVWSRSHTLRKWPTKPVRNATLRYSVHIPQWWSSEPTIHADTNQITHIYNQGKGGCNSEWLIITFLSTADGHSDMADWINVSMMLTGFPVITHDQTRGRLLPGSWECFGKMPNLAKELRVDEVHGYMGVAKYEQDSPASLGRLYVLLARRGTFAWNVALSLPTALGPGAAEDMLNSNDHNRAGAVLGTLKLDDASQGVANVSTTAPLMDSDDHVASSSS